MHATICDQPLRDLDVPLRPGAALAAATEALVVGAGVSAAELAVDPAVAQCLFERLIVVETWSVSPSSSWRARAISPPRNHGASPTKSASVLHRARSAPVHPPRSHSGDSMVRARRLGGGSETRGESAGRGVTSRYPRRVASPRDNRTRGGRVTLQRMDNVGIVVESLDPRSPFSPSSASSSKAEQ